LVDISKSDFKGFSIPDGNTDNDGFETKIDWFGTVRGKLGNASGPYLLYATGGLVYGQVKATQGDVDPRARLTRPQVLSPARIGVLVGPPAAARM
jgi:hypothetical protein